MRRRTYRRGRKKKSIWPKLFVLLILLGAGAYYAYTDPRFEQVPPEIITQTKVYSGTREPLRVVLRDNQALGDYQAVFSSGNRHIVAVSGRFDMPMQETEILVPFPPQVLESKEATEWTITITAKDKSLWNFFKGNLQTKVLQIVADTQPPTITIIAKSPTMARGGSALVVFRAEDSSMQEAYIMVGKIKFKALPYKKKGYYAALIAWPFLNKKLKAFAVGIDKAGNTGKKKITFNPVLRQHKVSWIKVSDRFLDGKIVEVAEKNGINTSDRMKRFKAVNETLRINNEKLIHRYAKVVTAVEYDSWKMKAFKPLKGAALVADFGDERHYYYEDKTKEVSRSYHLGYDFASTAHAPIYSSNIGKVVFAAANGIYGKMPLIDHAFGLFTLYGHCSRLLVKQGGEVDQGQVIAKTGVTGLALGDHLHFGLLVQGVEVWPMDWMKQNWIKSHIDDVFAKADSAIEK